MNWTLHKNSLHWKEECKEKGLPYSSHYKHKNCSVCNGEGHTIKKITIEKPECYYEHDTFHCSVCLDYKDQLSIIKELEEALRVEKPKEPTGLMTEQAQIEEGHKFYDAELLYAEAQTLLSKYTISEGKIIETLKT